MWSTDPYSSGAEVNNGVTASGYPESNDKATPIFSLSHGAGSCVDRWHDAEARFLIRPVDLVLPT
jgi:hypothetical protein